MKRAKKASKAEIIKGLISLIIYQTQQLAKKQTEIDELKERLSGYEKLQKEVQDKEVSTPSGMKEVYKKENKKKKRDRKPGCKRGHQGYRRNKPLNVDDEKRWTINICPKCDNQLSEEATEIEIRYTEDIEIKEAKTTEHHIERKYCPICDEIITATMTDALARSQLGLTTLIISAWLHYYLGVTIGNLLKWFSISSLLILSKGYFSQAWNRLAEILKPYYEEIKAEARNSAVLNVDESGWRNNGVTWWLWCFTNKTLAFFTIEKTRGSPVLIDILGELFKGVLISDFFGAYNLIKALAKQRCIVHLLREIKKVSKRNFSVQWVKFAKKVKRLFRDAILLAKKRETLSHKKYEYKKKRLYKRLKLLYAYLYEDKDCLRLAKRWLKKYENELFTFLDYPEVDADNNRCERTLRRPVIMRKNSYGNRSDKGTETQAIMMTIFMTLEMRGINPVNFLINALKKWISNGQLPPLPKIKIS